jgi:predicted NUDIX family NTP pyrophosphohydrolase
VSKTKIKSAGVLLYRIRDEQLEVFIGHMGGPFWA